MRLLLELGATPPASSAELGRANNPPKEWLEHPIAGCSLIESLDAVVAVFAEYGIEIVKPERLAKVKKAMARYEENRPSD